MLSVSRIRSARPSVVAHELNQPLTVITNYLEAARALLDHGGDLALPRIGSAIDRASEQAIRAGQIIQRLRGSCRAATASGGSRQNRQ
jgi:C4-dicarboxylate-specific signal transduction histidine kinase